MPTQTDREHGNAEPASPSPLTLWWRVLRIAYLRFGFSVSMLMAAAIAFFSLMCLAPLGILLAAALQVVLGPGSDAYQEIVVAVGSLGPEAAARIMPQVDELLQYPGTHMAGAISVIALVWASMRLFEIVERALTDIWPGKMLRSYLHRKAVALAMMVVAGLLLGSFVLFAAFLAQAHAWLARFPGGSGELLEHARPRFLLVAQFVLAYVAFALLYKFMPVQRVPATATLVGAGFAAALWQAASAVFTWTIRQSLHHGSFYGGLTGIVVFSMWCFLGAQMLLFGGHVAVAWEHVFHQRRGPEEDDELIAWPERATQQQS